MFHPEIQELSRANTCLDGTGAYYLATADIDGYAVVKFMQPGTHIACEVRIWLNNGQDSNIPANNILQHEERLPANTRNIAGIARIHPNNVRFPVHKGMRVFATLTIAQPEPIVITTTIMEG